MRSLLVIVIVLFTACQSDIIPCPHVKTGKLKESTARRGKVKKHIQEEINPIAVTSRRHNYIPTRSKPETLADKIDVEEWDCPKPGSRENQKIIKEHKKRMEKRIRSMMKKQDTMDSLSVRHF